MPSEILDIAHDLATGLFKAGAMDEITKRKIDALCLPQKRTFTPDEIRSIRKVNNVSQAVFAAFLGIGKTTVQQWERGQKKPSGPSMRLLDLVDRKGLAVLV